ncbi:hypothetical protein ACFFMP_02520 [Pseudoroseomonas cervicalis]|uniref:Uncharacterized protein n=1 Tax=Pseudoroseomonas cervicalis ATCC 49957 TaxID=525371 RepID=D5RM51_9PROT|nr:hypothetical protein [Pseudoroseomonas cervicalis]EFH11603.1 hypothetical protein HMPREF0731_2162 [Pseudoroseomonas cervicalis ATCC 49957]
MKDVSPIPPASTAELRRTESRIRYHLRRAAPAGLTRDGLGALLEAESISARNIGGMLGRMVEAGTLRMASSEAGLLFWMPLGTPEMRPDEPANWNAQRDATPRHRGPIRRQWPAEIIAPAPTTPVVHERGVAMPPPPKGEWPERREAPAVRGLGRFALDFTVGCGAGICAVAILWAFGLVTVGGGL